MMQLVCNGVRLDIYEDAGVQFTHQNPLFAFDDLKCERTTQFKLPSTPTNDRVFGLARVPAYKGDGMRRRFSAELQMGVVVKNGFLYVTSYDGKDYEAVFVTGELLGLLKIREAGKLRDFYCPTDATVWGAAADAEDSIADVWKGVKYMQARTVDAVINPSAQIKGIIEGACAQLGVPVTLPAGAEKYRLIVPEIKPYEADRTYKSTAHVPVDADDACNALADVPAIFEPVLIPIYDFYGTVRYFDDGKDHGYYYYYAASPRLCYVRGYRAKIRAAILLTENFDRRYILCKGMSVVGSYENNLVRFDLPEGEHLDINAFGIKQPRYNLNEPQSVEIQAGEAFFFLNYDDVKVLRTNPEASEEGETFKIVELASGTARYETAGQPDYTLYAKEITGARATGYVEDGKYEVVPYEVGDTVELYPVLPDASLVDLLKAVAYMTGKVLNCTDADGVTFDDLDVAAFPATDLTASLIKTSAMSRSFADYAQRNVLAFESDETVTEPEKIANWYTIENENLEQSKDLATIFASEGSAAYVDAVAYVYMRNAVEDIKKYTLATAEASREYLTRVTLPVNAGLVRLCCASTSITAQIRCTLLDYELIAANSAIDCGGIRYVWTEAQWSKTVVTFKLAKI